MVSADRIFVAAAAAVMCALITAATSCSTCDLKAEPKANARNAGVLTGGVAVITMAHASSQDVGILTVRQTAAGTEWNLSNQTAAGVQPLSEGHAATPVFREVVAEVEQHWPRSRENAGAYRVTVQIFDGGALVSEYARVAAEGDDLRPLLPQGAGFQEIWDSASGIPKMYWYRFLGPYRWEGSETLPWHPPAQPRP